jgi:hypothetical protein
MEQPTESVPSHNPSGRRDDRRVGGPERWCLPQGAMRTVHVVVIGVLGQHRPQRPTPKDQHPVKQLTPHRAHPPLRGGVRPRRPHRHAQHLDPRGGNDRIERGGERGLPVAAHHPEPTNTLRKVQHQVAGLPGHPRPAGCAVTPSTWPRRVAIWVANSTHTRRRKTVSTVQEVHRQHPGRLRTQALPPRDGRPLGCRIDASALQDGPHRAGPDPVPVAEAAQLAVAAALPPGRVLPASRTTSARSSAATLGRPRRW